MLNEKLPEVVHTAPTKEVIQAVAHMRNINKTTEPELETGKLSDLPDKAAYFILHTYFISDQMYTRRQEKISEEGEKQFYYLPLHYIFTYNTEKMYQAIHTLAEKKVLTGKNSNQISGDNTPRNFKMSADFIKQLESHGPKSVFISRTTLHKALKNIKQYHHAVIMYHVFPDQRLSSIARGIGQYQNKIEKIDYRTREKHLEWAFYALAEAIRNIEGKKKNARK